MHRPLPKTLLLCLLFSGIVSMSGCGGKSVVFVEAGDAVQIGPDGAWGKVFTIDKDGNRTLSKDKVRIPGGYWCVPDSEEQQ